MGPRPLATLAEYEGGGASLAARLGLSTTQLEALLAGGVAPTPLAATISRLARGLAPLASLPRSKAAAQAPPVATWHPFAAGMRLPLALPRWRIAVEFVTPRDTLHVAPAVAARSRLRALPALQPLWRSAIINAESWAALRLPTSELLPPPTVSGGAPADDAPSRVTQVVARELEAQLAELVSGRRN